MANVVLACATATPDRHCDPLADCAVAEIQALTASFLISESASWFELPADVVYCLSVAGPAHTGESHIYDDDAVDPGDQLLRHFVSPDRTVVPRSECGYSGCQPGPGCLELQHKATGNAAVSIRVANPECFQDCTATSFGYFAASEATVAAFSCDIENPAPDRWQLVDCSVAWTIWP